MRNGRQTEIRGIPLLFHTRSPLMPYQEIMFVEAVSMTAIAHTTTYVEVKKMFLQRIEFFIGRLQSAILAGPHMMSGFSVNQDILYRQQDLFWRRNIEYAAEHLRSRSA